MQNILWLASWYPNKYDPYNCDFVQRHAFAVAPFCKLSVISVQFVPTDWQVPLEVIEQKNTNSFPETIIYLKQSSLPSPFNKLIDQYRYMKAFKQEVRKYLANNSPSVAHVHIPVKAGIIGMWLKRKMGIPIVVTEHLGIYNHLAPDNYFKRSAWFKNLTKRVIKYADVFLPVSKSSGDLINKIVVAKPFTVVKNVVDTRLFFYNPTDNSPLFWVVHVSMMNHPKNPKGLLRAFAEAVKLNNNIRLRMIGDAKDDLIAYTNELGISDFVVYTGMLPQERVAPLVQQSDVFLLFSNYENMPCVLAEALCCGLPIIATNVGGIAEIITENNGILIEPSNEKACTEAILKMSLYNNQYNKQSIAEDAASTFSYEVIGKQLSEIYQQTGVLKY